MKKRAFTLAEVLITLGIIGVVSALTIPTLVQRNTNETHVQQLKKVYATLMQASETAMAENNASDLHDTVLGVPTGASAAVNKAAVKSFFNTYFKVAVDCDSKPVPCFATSYKGLDGSSTVLANFAAMNFSSGNCVSLADGAAVCMYYGMGPEWTDNGGNTFHNSINIWVDVNGPKGPNIIGRDLFNFDLYSDGKVAEHYIANASYMQNHFEGSCQSGGYGGCFDKIVLDGWKMDY